MLSACERVCERVWDQSELLAERLFSRAAPGKPGFRKEEMSTNFSPNCEATPAPPADWDGLDSQAHAVQFYAEDASLLDGLGRFIGSVIGAGDAAVVIATKAHRDGLAQRLQASGLDVAVAQKRGRFVALDAAETLSKFMVNGWPDATRFAELLGPIVSRAKAASRGEQSRVAAFGEMVALLWAEGKPEAALRLEQLWNELSKTHSFYLRCAYPMSGFYREGHGEPLLKICAEHSSVIPVESYTSLMSEEDRLRSITILQHKALALEAEVAERKEVQKNLERREAELADFLENAVEGVQQVGADQRILWANKSLLNLLGYTAQEYVGHQLGEFHAQKEVFDEFWRKLMRREDIYDFPAALLCKDGSIKNVLIHSNVLWEGEQFIHTRCFVRDVTEHTRMDQALRRTEKLAAMGKLAASIAHEINNPLEAVTNLFYLLKQHPSLDPQAHHYAALADQELKRVSHITKQTLAFYRNSDHAVQVSVPDVLDTVLEAYVPRARKRGVAIHKQYDTKGQLLAFPDELRQVFANLVGNAIEATDDDGEIRLHVFASHNRNCIPGIRVNICDTGVVISAADRQRIFEPFFTTKAEKGTGLGLWVSKGILQKYDGYIRFHSGKIGNWAGTCFSVFLPTESKSEKAVASANVA
jgi:PAS domain S-box-containing protein